MFRLLPTPRFERRLRRFLRQHPELTSRVEQILTALEEDPYQRGLRLHALSGPMQGISAVSVTPEYRLTLELDDRGGRATLLDIGTHREVYR